jgi:chromosome segregation ATPase
MTLDKLAALEAKIQEAADRLGDYAERNAELEQRVAELESALEAALEAEPDRDAKGTGSSAAWQKEKAEITRRVDQLVARLEELLRDA